MAEHDELTTGVHRVEQAVEALATRIDKGFDGVDAAFLDMRTYTEHAFETVRAEMRSGFQRMDRRFEQVDRRFEQVDRRFERIDERFERIDERFDQIDGRFGQMDSRFDRLERKFDQFIDVQTKTNALIERRLERLEDA